MKPSGSAFENVEYLEIPDEGIGNLDDDHLYTSGSQTNHFSSLSLRENPEFGAVDEEFKRSVNFSEEELQRQLNVQVAEDWEHKMLEEINHIQQQHFLEDVQGEKIDLIEAVTGIDYYDNPRNSSSWLHKLPSKLSKNSVFAEQIKQSLLPKVYSLSVKEQRLRSKELLQLSDIGPPIIVHHHPPPSALKNLLVTSSLASTSAPTISRTTSSANFQFSKSKQNQESQVLHYEPERDPLLLNQKKKHYGLPRSPITGNQDGSDQLSKSMKRRLLSSTGRSLSRKLLVALEKPPSSAAFLQNDKGGISSKKPSDDFRNDKHTMKRALSHSTGALLKSRL
jgi:hypothetical protein